MCVCDSGAAGWGVWPPTTLLALEATAAVLPLTRDDGAGEAPLTVSRCGGACSNPTFRPGRSSVDSLFPQ